MAMETLVGTYGDPDFSVITCSEKCLEEFCEQEAVGPASGPDEINPLDLEPEDRFCEACRRPLS